MKISKYFVALAFMPLLAWSSELELKIPGEVPYLDKSLIKDNVISECKDLGTQFSERLAKTLTNKGYSPQKFDVLDPTKGQALDVKIANVYSAGNAFTLHRKTITVQVKSYKDGQITGTETFKRFSMGGITGGFKSSCSVLNGVADSLAKDIGNWYSTKK